MGDSKEISKSLIEEGDIYQKVDLAFKVSTRNTHDLTSSSSPPPLTLN